MSDTVRWWKLRGMRDALAGRVPLDFSDAPSNCTAEDVRTRRDAYLRGYGNACPSCLTGHHGAIGVQECICPCH